MPSRTGLYLGGLPRSELDSLVPARIQLQDPAPPLLMVAPDHRDRRNEAVAAPRERLDEARILRRIAQSFPQLVDRRSQAMVKVDDRVVAPEPVLDLIPRDHFARPLQHANQNPEGLRLQTNADAGFAQLSRLGICLEQSEAKSAGRLFLMLDWGRHKKVLGSVGDITLYPRWGTPVNARRSSGV